MKKNIIYPPLTDKRNFPVNFMVNDTPLFEKEFVREIPQSYYYIIKNAIVLNEGVVLKKRFFILKESTPNIGVSVWKLYFFNFKNFVRILYKILFVKNECIYNKAFVVFDNYSLGYYHWITEVLTRIVIAKKINSEAVFLFPESFFKYDYVEQSLDLMDIKYEKFKIKLKVENLYFVTHTASVGNYNPEVLCLLREHFRKKIEEEKDINLNEKYCKIYISRDKAKVRKVINEKDVIEIVTKYGYKVVYNEDLSWYEQIILYYNVEKLISIHGAGLTNMIFMKEGTSVLEFRWENDTHNNCYYSMASVLNIKYYYLKCKSVSDIKNPTIFNFDLFVDVKRLENLLQDF